MKFKKEESDEQIREEQIKKFMWSNFHCIYYR